MHEQTQINRIIPDSGGQGILARGVREPSLRKGHCVESQVIFGYGGLLQGPMGHGSAQGLSTLKPGRCDLSSHTVLLGREDLIGMDLSAS